MKDILTDIVAHTHSLSILPLVKITGTETETAIEAMAEDRSVILSAKSHEPVEEFQGVFGMPNLDKLKLHLNYEEYKEDAKIELTRAVRNGEEIPTGIHFENTTGDFKNDYRFMNADIINEKLKTVKFKGANWDVSIEPSISSIQRLKYQAQAHSEESTFQVKTENNNLVLFFGDAGTHAGSFVFQSDIESKLKQTWAWPVSQVLSILNLSGDKKLMISDAGAMMISVDSGLASYDYILPAAAK
jgi:hypothetical protein